MRKIFYSWQSDIPKNRSYIEECLKEAVSRLDNYEIETATRNTSGAPDIAATILDKIRSCDLFLADISIINHLSSERKCPNPNVLYELGFAVGIKGSERIILLANNETTKTEELPFDIRNRRMLIRAFKPENKKQLTQDLVDIISGYADIELQDNFPEVVKKWHQITEKGHRSKIREEGFHTYMELETDLSMFSKEFDKKTIKDIARKSTISTFGWPIGVFLENNSESAPKVSPDSIYAEVTTDRGEDGKTYDYWAIHSSGSFYLIKSLFEDISRPGFVFYDTRIIRITESLLYLKNLYESLGVPLDKKFKLKLTHSGLKGKTLTKASTQGIFFDDRKSTSDDVTTTIELSIKDINDNLVDLVNKLTRPLLELFDLFSVPADQLEKIVTNFKQGKIT